MWCLLAVLAGCATPSVPSGSETSASPADPAPPSPAQNGTTTPDPAPPIRDDFVHTTHHEGAWLLWEETRDGNNSRGHTVGDGPRRYPVNGGWSSFWVNGTWTDPIEATWRICVSVGPFIGQGNVTHHVPPTKGSTHCSQPMHGSAQLRMHELVSLDMAGCIDLDLELVSSPNPLENQSAATQIDIAASIIYRGEAGREASRHDSEVVGTGGC